MNGEALIRRLVYLVFALTALEYFCWCQSIRHVANIPSTDAHITNLMSSYHNIALETHWVGNVGRCV